MLWGVLDSGEFPAMFLSTGLGEVLDLFLNGLALLLQQLSVFGLEFPETSG